MAASHATTNSAMHQRPLLGDWNHPASSLEVYSSQESWRRMNSNVALVNVHVFYLPSPLDRNSKTAQSRVNDSEGKTWKWGTMRKVGDVRWQRPANRRVGNPYIDGSGRSHQKRRIKKATRLPESFSPFSHSEERETPGPRGQRRG